MYIAIVGSAIFG